MEGENLALPPGLKQASTSTLQPEDSWMPRSTRTCCVPPDYVDQSLSLFSLSLSDKVAIVGPCDSDPFHEMAKPMPGGIPDWLVKRIA